MRPVILFDIETVPDFEMARRTLREPGLGDVEAMARLFPPKKDGEEFGFPKTLYHQVAEVAVATIDKDGQVEFLGALSSLGLRSELEMLQGFWAGVDRHLGARLVTFNGRRFDVPVLTQRALASRVSPRPIFTSDYRQRFKDGHTDIMEVLSDFGSSTPLSQNEAAVMLGVPGKLGVDGGDVATLWAEGKRDEIAAYCTCDVATLTLCFARLGVHAGWCSEEESQRIEEGVRDLMPREGHPLFKAFWDALAS